MSLPPEANILPSREKATLNTLVCVPRKSGRAVPSVASHKRTESSAPAVASTLPSGAKASPELDPWGTVAAEAPRPTVTVCRATPSTGVATASSISVGANASTAPGPASRAWWRAGGMLHVPEQTRASSPPLASHCPSAEGDRVDRALMPVQHAAYRRRWPRPTGERCDRVRPRRRRGRPERRRGSGPLRVRWAARRPAWTMAQACRGPRHARRYRCFRPRGASPSGDRASSSTVAGAPRDRPTSPCATACRDRTAHALGGRRLTVCHRPTGPVRGPASPSPGGRLLHGGQVPQADRFGQPLAGLRVPAGEPRGERGPIGRKFDRAGNGSRAAESAAPLARDSIAHLESLFRTGSALRSVPHLPARRSSRPGCRSASPRRAEGP